MLYNLLLTRNKEQEDSVCANNSKVLGRNTCFKNKCLDFRKE